MTSIIILLHYCAVLRERLPISGTRALENAAPNRSKEIGDNDRERVKKKTRTLRKARDWITADEHPLSLSLPPIQYMYVYLPTCIGLDDIYTYIRGAIPWERSSPT